MTSHDLIRTHCLLVLFPSTKASKYSNINRSMPRDDIKTIIDRIGKPLGFAARDNFAHLRSLAALEPFMQAQIQELRRCSADPARLQQLESLFSGFDTLPADQKKDRIQRASTLITALEPGRIVPAPMAGRRNRTGSLSTATQADAPAAPVALDTPIQYCKGIGPKRAELLKKDRHLIRSKTRSFIFPGATRTGAT